jgi:hypothetical protein
MNICSQILDFYGLVIFSGLPDSFISSGSCQVFILSVLPDKRVDKIPFEILNV